MYAEQRRERKKLFWNSTAKAGLYAGGMLALGLILSYTMNSTTSVGTAGMIVISYIMAKLFTQKVEARGEIVTYLNALRFLVMTTIFAGVIYGAAMFVMYSKIDPSYYRDQYYTTLNHLEIPKELVETVEGSYELYVKNPILVIISAIFSTLTINLIPLLILSFLTKTKNKLKTK